MANTDLSRVLLGARNATRTILSARSFPHSYMVGRIVLLATRNLFCASRCGLIYPPGCAGAANKSNVEFEILNICAGIDYYLWNL